MVDMDQEQKDFQRDVPTDKIELDIMTMNPDWGAGKIPAGLKKVLQELIRKEEDGKQSDDLNNYWELLSFYTRDIRLGNLSQSELNYCTHYLDLAGDLLKQAKPKAFLVNLSRAITILETTQSKKGFLRRINKTQTREWKESTEQQQKKNIFGVQKSEM